MSDVLVRSHPARTARCRIHAERSPGGLDYLAPGRRPRSLRSRTRRARGLLALVPPAPGAEVSERHGADAPADARFPGLFPAMGRRGSDRRSPAPDSPGYSARGRESAHDRPPPPALAPILAANVPHPTVPAASPPVLDASEL